MKSYCLNFEWVLRYHKNLCYTCSNDYTLNLRKKSNRSFCIQFIYECSHSSVSYYNKRIKLKFGDFYKLLIYKIFNFFDSFI